MSKVHNVIRELHRQDEMVSRDIWINKIHPVAKLCVTFGYLVSVMSYGWDNILPLVSMCLYLIINLILGDISFINILKRLWFIFVAITLFALLNPVFDRNVYAVINGYNITNGMISAIALTLKGYFSVIAVSILGETTSMNDICYALQKLHIPKIIVTMISLINRYIMMLLQETNRTLNAYSIRSPYEKGVNKKAWGSLLGNMILRSIDRAERVYDSMVLRGFNGSFYYSRNNENNALSVVYAVLFLLSFIVLKFIPLFEITGEWLCNL